MEKILAYFTENIDIVLTEKTDKDMCRQLGHLDRAQRGMLRNSLFEAAKSLVPERSKEDTINWLHQCFQLIDKNSYHFDKVLFSPGPEIEQTIYGLLKNAKTSIHLCIFTITDVRLADELIRCHKKGVKVKIVTDDRKTHDQGSEIKTLVAAGIPVKTDHSRYHMHNKFGIIDGRVAITGSFNWTYTATEHNQENLLATTNFTIVRQYQDEFNRLWDEMYWF
jgi:phosphatidylserine/phosphatidylglycerophosphate/cardiolipin synthase-like enzyme